MISSTAVDFILPRRISLSIAPKESPKDEYKYMNRTDFLPISLADVKARGWSEVDFVYVTGDAYVDHPKASL